MSKNGEKALMIIVIVSMLIFLINTLDCTFYIWYHEDMLDDKQRCGSNVRKDNISALKEICSLVLAFMAGRSSGQ